MSILKTIKDFFSMSPEEKAWHEAGVASSSSDGETRSAIKGQLAEDEEPDIPYSEDEQAIIDRFEHLPGKCKRKAQRMIKGGPQTWAELSTFCDEHEVAGHTHK